MSIIAKKANFAEIDTPSTGKVSLYVDCNDGKIKIKNDNGCVYQLECAQPIECYAIDMLIIGGGGGGGSYCYQGGNGTSGGGGGAGGVVCCLGVTPECTNYSITIGLGGDVNTNGGNTCFGNIIAYGGGAGNSCNGGSGGGGKGNLPIGTVCVGGRGIDGQGHNGGNSHVKGGHGGGGGGGAGGAGANGCGGSMGGSLDCGGTGGIGIISSFSGKEECYAGGGGGGAFEGVGLGQYGGGQGANRMHAGTNGTTYGSGGGGGEVPSGGCGYQGVVMIRYASNGSNGILCATGGRIYGCNGYTIHVFEDTSKTQTFCIVCCSNFYPVI